MNVKENNLRIMVDSDNRSVNLVRRENAGFQLDSSILAIKFLMAATGCSLRDGKKTIDAINQILAELRPDVAGLRRTIDSQIERLTARELQALKEELSLVLVRRDAISQMGTFDEDGNYNPRR